MNKRIITGLILLIIGILIGAAFGKEISDPVSVEFARVSIWHGLKIVALLLLCIIFFVGGMGLIFNRRC